MTEKKECAACGHEIDAAARICPYCAGDPETGRRVDPAPILQSHFPMRDTAPRARVVQFLRERQGLVVTALIIGVFLLVGAAHQMVTRRNQALESSAPAVPLTDLADLNQPSEEKQLPIPDLQFTWTGRPETMDVLLVEPGAVAPPAPAAGPPGAAIQGAAAQGPAVQGAAVPGAANAAPPASAVRPPPIRQERPLTPRPPANQPPRRPQGAVQ